jgi:Trypsin
LASTERIASVVRLNDVNLAKDSEAEVTIDILEQIIHPNYRISQRYDDIALIKLVRDIDLPKSYPLLPICLWTEPSIEPGVIATAIGFGFTESM